MPQGIQVWDGAGNLVLDSPTRVGRILGWVSIGPSNQSGAVSNQYLTQGVPFYIYMSTTLFQVVNVSFSGTTMFWEPAPNSSLLTSRLFYGVR